MRSRSNSGVRLDYYHRIVYRTILRHQDAVTGLLPASNLNDHAWVRDNLYSIMAVWGLSMAYKKNADLDEDRAKTYELEQSCVKLMRGLLNCMMQQLDKVEKFKHTQAPIDSLHAKYSSKTGQIVVKDNEWGHLQIDATSLFLLVLAQMTASGLQIVFNLDEVSFIQNLVFYIESAYCIPDYGIWERGDKTNHGLPELNASSIGLAKAALEAMNELDLFGARGGPASVIHVLADEAQKCQAVLQSMLPRESNSKEVDSSLLAVISFPSFAVDDPMLIKLTRDTIQDKLQGRYGCKRFLRDGYKTAKEDPSRLYYEPWELKRFEKIECEWPLFYCYLILDYCFQNDKEAVKEYAEQLEELLVTTDDGLRLVPEIYTVPAENVEQEYKEPGSQDRVAVGKLPFMWAQSLFIMGRLLQDNFLACGELDPLNRRLGSEKKPDVVVQVVVLAEDSSIQAKLQALDIPVQTIAEVAPIEVQPARVLSKLYAHLGRNQKLGLSGRQSRDVGILSTSKLYSLQDRIFAFTPQYFDYDESYLSNDVDLGMYCYAAALDYLRSTWKDIGRPTVCCTMRTGFLDEDGKIPTAMVSTLKKIKSGYINGTRVALGKMQEFLNTSCITSLNFLHDNENGYPDSLKPEVKDYLEKQMRGSLSWRRADLVRMSSRFGEKKSIRDPTARRKFSVKGTIRKSRTLLVDDEKAYGPTLGLTLEVPSQGSSRRESTVASPTGEQGPPILEVSCPATPTRFTPPLSSRSRSPSPEKEELWETMVRHSRVASDAVYENVEFEELLLQMREAESLEEQGDILHYLVVQFGLNYETGSVIEGQPVIVKDLLKDLYERACHDKNWALVRHTAGMLGKRVEDLAKAVTDLLVRQKQVTVGLPPHHEVTITAPLPASELRVLIHTAYGADESTAMLTQELLVYLAMFIRTEPSLFHEMLRLRVGLIIQVMASELARTIKCEADIASDHLLNLSPFEMKNLLHHIMSGKEFNIGSARSGTFFISSKSTKLSKKSTIGSFLGTTVEGEARDLEADRHGQWLRRRRLDGALNRVPLNFYPRIWKILEKCQGINIEGKVIPQSLTQEMTAGELKFALEVETVLNTIPQPEYRQLVVEALMVLSLVREYHSTGWLGDIVSAQDIVHLANNIFLQDQKQEGGDATTCCARDKKEPGIGGGLTCGGAAYICIHFYDSAPSGKFGTMSYMIRAVCCNLNCFPQDGEMDCTVS